MTQTQVQVKLGTSLYTYLVRHPDGAGPKPGDTVRVPPPAWALDSPGDLAAVVHAGDQCVDTGYDGPLAFAVLEAASVTEAAENA
jgi:hypothetical protein